MNGTGAWRKLRDRAALLFVALLLLDSFGVNNIPFGALPAALLIAGGLSVSYAFSEFPHLKKSSAFQLLALCYLVVITVTFFRLPGDLAVNGIDAARDTLFLVDVGGIFVGAGLARSVEASRLSLFVSTTLIICLAWFALSPFADWIIANGPVVGVQRPEPLASFYSIGYVSVLGFAWFAPRRGLAPAMLAMGFLVIVVIGQFKSSVLAVGLLMLAVMVLFGLQLSNWGARRTDPGVLTRIPALLGLAALVAIAVSSAGVQTPGRLGAATPLEVAGRILVADAPDTPGSESIDYRKQWQRSAIQELTSGGWALLTGGGLGGDLTGGFRSSSDAAVRSPHNDFLEYATRLGLPAGIAWLVMVVVVPLYLVLRLRDSVSVVSGLGFLLAWWTFASTQSFFSFTYGGFPFWVTVGVLIRTAGVPLTRHNSAAAADSRAVGAS